MIKKISNSSLLQTSGIYTLANIINRAIPFLLLPVLTTYLTPTDYGIVSMFTVLIGLFIPFVGLSMYGAINRKFFDKQKDFPTYISTALFILIGSSIALSLIVYIFRDLIASISEFPEDYLYLVVLVVLANTIVQITLSLWQVREQALKYGVFQVLLTILNLSLTLILVMQFDYGWQGRVYGQVIAALCFAMIGFFIIIKREKLKITWQKEYIKEILSFGIPLIPHALGMFLITMTDRIFVTNMVGISETGIYTVGFQIGMIIQVLQDSFNKAWQPYLYKNLKVGTTAIKFKIVKITYIYFLVILVFASTLSLVSPFITELLLGEGFSGSVVYVAWIAFGFAFNGMYKMVGGVIFYERKTNLLARVTFITAVLNIAFNYIFISLNGAVGAAQATSLAFFVSFILTWILASKVYTMPWKLWKY